MPNNPLYISPNLRFFQTFVDLKNKNPQGGWYSEKLKISPEDILKHNKVIILADPGCGKTELLKQVQTVSSQNNLKSILINLKNLDYTKNLSENIIAKAKRTDTVKTPDFKLIDSNKVIVCLDALDEVSSMHLNRLIEMIKDFMTQYTNAHVYITCRTLYFNNFFQEFIGFQFQFIAIDYFMYHQIYAYLEQSDFTEIQINSVLKSFSDKGTISVIHTPRYLDLLVKYVKENGYKELEKLTRCQLFEYFVYNKLNKEKSVLGKLDSDLIKRVLETLAITMEIYQTNIISKDELMTFFRDIQNDLKINILSHITIDEFIDKSILKNNIDTVEFDNTEFQEYLAAKEIQRFNKISLSVHDLAVNGTLREIYPSWFNVLGYLIEMKIDLLEDIVEFGMEGDKTIVDGYFRLVTDVNVHLLNTSIRSRIFKGIFEYHQRNHLTLEFNFCHNLAYYYTTENWDLLVDYSEKQYENPNLEHLLVRNVFYIIFDLLKLKYLSKKQVTYVTNKLISFLESKTAKIELKEQLLYLTEYIKDKRILRLLSQFPHDDKDMLYTLINAAGNIDVNDEYTLSLIIQALENHSVSGSHEMFDLTSKKSIKKLFKHLNNNVHLIDNLLEITSDSYTQKSIDDFLETLRPLLDKELTNLLIDFIIKSFNREVHHNRYSKFLKKLISLVSKKRKRLVFELIDIFSEHKADIYSFEILQAFVQCLQKNQIKEFISTINKKFPENVWLARNTLYNFKYSQRSDAQEMFEAGRTFFEKEYTAIDREQEKSRKQDKRSEGNDYRRFKTHLDPSTSQNYFITVFRHYFYNHKTINPYLKEKEREKLIKLTGIFLKSYNPAVSGLVITEEKNDRTSYTTDKNIQFYGEAIICAQLLSIDVNEYRQNIINFIPFSYHNHFEAITSMVANITHNEVRPLIEIYSKKTDDLWRFMPGNFLNVVEKLNLSESQNVLEELVETKVLRIVDQSYRIKAFTLADSFKNDKNYVKEIINKYKDSDIENGIVEEGYRILIEKYNDKEAIELRHKEVFERAFEFQKIRRSHSVDWKESELTYKKFANPIMQLTNPSYINLYIQLLENSYKIQAKGKRFWDYAQYMREIVIAYFRNLRIHRKFEYFTIFQEAAKKYKDEVGYDWFLKNISILKNQYLEYIGKPTNISECIQQYNNIKNRQYIDISNTHELATTIKRLITNDLNTWILGDGTKILQGFKKNNRANETELQKLIKIQLENILLKSGLVPIEQPHIYREVQSIDDTRIDFLITYGFIKPVILELKMSDHSELNKSNLEGSKSYINLSRYINNFEAEHCLFLVYENQIRAQTKFKEHLKSIANAYQKIPNVEVVGIPVIQ